MPNGRLGGESQLPPKLRSREACVGNSPPGSDQRSLHPARRHSKTIPQIHGSAKPTPRSSPVRTSPTRT